MSNTAHLVLSRDLGEARVLLARLIGVREIVDIIMKPVAIVVKASIKVQAYGRGLLARFRDHRLSYRNFVPALRRETGAFTADEIQDIDDGNWHFSEWINPDMSGYKAIRRTRANRRSLRRLFNIDNGFLGQLGLDHAGRQRHNGIMALGTAERWDRTMERGQARFRWMHSHRDLSGYFQYVSGYPLIQN